MTNDFISVQLEDSPPIYLEITDNNQSIEVHDLPTVKNTLEEHSNSRTSHPLILKDIESSNLRINLLDANLNDCTQNFSKKFLEVEQNIQNSTLGSSTRTFEVAAPTIASHAVNKGYMSEYFQANKPEKEFCLFDFKISDHLIENLSWKIADNSWLSRADYPDAYDLLLSQGNGGSAVTDTNIYIQNNVVTNKNVSCVKGLLGYKIVTSSTGMTSVGELFTATGSAWYYQLDTVNQKFKLPRTTNFFQLLTGASGLGNFVESGLPNITGTMAGNVCNTSGTPSGCYKSNGVANYGGTVSGITGNFLGFDASLSNKFYGNSNVVQPRANKMLLYFKVKI